MQIARGICLDKKEVSILTCCGKEKQWNLAAMTDGCDHVTCWRSDNQNNADDVDRYGCSFIAINDC